MKAYTRPELIVLGDAVALIHGSKGSIGDNANPMLPGFQAEEQLD